MRTARTRALTAGAVLAGWQECLRVLLLQVALLPRVLGRVEAAPLGAPPLPVMRLKRGAASRHAGG